MDGETSKRRKIQEPTNINDNFSTGESSKLHPCEPDDRKNLAEDFIPSCPLITSNIFKYLSVKDLLKLSCVSRQWFISTREYLRIHPKLHCPLALNEIDGLEALNNVNDILSTQILNQTHPFTGIYVKFKDPIDNFFKVGRDRTKRPERLPSVDPSNSFSQSFVGDISYSDEVDYDQDYETFDAWMFRQNESKQEREKVNGPLKRIFNKIPMKHVYLYVNYGSKQCFSGEKFQNIMSILPLQNIEFFATNLRISEFIYRIKPGQLPNLKTIRVEELMNAKSATVNQLLAACPALENWASPIPATMVSAFGTKKCLVKKLLLTKFLSPGAFQQILNANLMLEELVCSSKCSIAKSSYANVVRLIQNNANTLQVIHMSDALVKFVGDSDLPQMTNIRKLILAKISKATKIKALSKFPNAKITDGRK